MTKIPPLKKKSPSKTRNQVNERKARLAGYRKALKESQNGRCRTSKLELHTARRILSIVVMAGVLKHCHANYDEAKALTRVVIETLLP